MPQHDVFISYAHADKVAAQDLKGRLEEAHVKVWMDDRLQGGEDWQERIAKAIRACKVVTLVASGTSFTSDEVKQELRVAKLTKTAILPVYLEDVELPDHLLYQLAGVQHVELHRSDVDEAFQEILRALVSFGCQCSREMTARELEEPSRALLTYGDQRLFLFGMDILGFGKAKKKSLPTVDLTLRVLPLANRILHPDNWRKTGKLSAHHGSFSFMGNQLFLHDLSTNGIYFERAAMEGDIEKTFLEFTEVAGLDSEDHGDERLPMNAVVALSSRRVMWLAADVLQIEACPIVRADQGTVGLHLRRLGNHPEHSYLQLASEVTWGRCESADVRMTDPETKEFLVAIERGPKHFNLKAMEGDVCYAGKQLRQGQQVVLEPGESLVVGGTAVEFRTATDDDFDAK